MFRSREFFKELELKLNRYLFRHPVGAFVLLFAAMPVGVLTALLITTMTIMYPAYLLLGLL